MHVWHTGAQMSDSATQNLLEFFYYLSNTLFIFNFSECPTGWEEFDQFCYRFVRSDLTTKNEAKDACAKDGAYLLSVNSDFEHSFVLESLGIHDPGQTKCVSLTRKI